MLKHLSYSSLSLFWQCPEAFRLRYCGPKPPNTTNSALLTGVATHEAVAACAKQHMADPTIEFPATYIDDLVLQCVSKHWDGFRPGDKELTLPLEILKSAVVRDASRAARYYVQNELPNRRPIAVETAFELTHPFWPIPVVGRLDLVEKDLVCDLKTSKRTPDQNAADDSDQLTLYALAYLAETNTIPAVQLDFIVLTDRTHMLSRTSTRKMSDLQGMVERIAVTQQAILQLLDNTQPGHAPAEKWSPALRGKWGKCKSMTCDFYKVCTMGGGVSTASLEGLKSIPTAEEIEEDVDA